MFERMDLTEPAYRDGYLRHHDRSAPVTSASAGTGSGAGTNRRLDAGESSTAATGAPPTVSICVPLFAPPRGYLRHAIASVRRQTYPHWQLILADDANADASLTAFLDEQAQSDPRIVVACNAQHGHIARATNLAIAQANGELVTFLDQDDALHPQALQHVVEAFATNPKALLVYSDEDRIDPFGARFLPYFKPDWSPELLLAQNYICHLAVYRASLLRRLGGLRPGLEGSQDHDLALRAARTVPSGAIVHLPRVLYHWRTIGSSTATHGAAAKPYALAAGQRALQDHVVHEHPAAKAETSRGFYRVHWPKSAKQKLHIILHGPRAAPTTTAQALRQHHDIRIDTLPVSVDARTISAAINASIATHPAADVVLLLKYDITFSEEAIDILLRQLARRNIGTVTGKLTDTLNQIVQLGLVVDPDHGPQRSHASCPTRNDGYFGRAQLTHNVVATHRDLMAFRRHHWAQAGGFGDAATSAAADLAFCVQLTAQNLRHVVEPAAAFTTTSAPVANEAQTPSTRPQDVTPVSWPLDPYFSPHLTVVPTTHALKPAAMIPTV